MEARCFECGTTLVHSDTYMAEDVLTVEGYEGDNKALMQCYYCPHCGREYNVFDPTEDKRETTYNEYWSKQCVQHGLLGRYAPNARRKR